MGIRKIFAAVFAALGCLVMAGSVVLCLSSLKAPVKMDQIPQGAENCTEKLVQALNDGEYAAAGECIYGQPELGMEGQPAGEVGALIWAAFEDSLSVTFKGECYATDGGIFRDVTVTSLETASVAENLQTRAHTLLSARVENAQDMAELYDSENNFREDLVNSVLLEAVEQAIAEDARVATRDLTLTLICRDGQWWVVADQQLLQALSGGLA